MFKENKYTQIYYSIIARSKSRTLQGYVERHHIIPKSLGGNNSVDNIAVLTAREHYICHRLLVKMTTSVAKQKMSYALHRITNKKSSVRITARTYQILREQHSKMMSEALTGVSTFERCGKLYSHAISDYQKQRIRESNSSRIWTDESKQRVSESQKERYRQTPEKFGKYERTDATRKKISENRKRNSIQYQFIHDDGSVFEGTTGDLARLVNSNGAEIWKLAHGRYKSFKGWRMP